MEGRSPGRGLCATRKAAASALTGWLIALGGCEHTEQQIERRREAERVVYALESLRNAPNDAKPPLLKALEGVACVTEEICELKRTCVGAYEVHLRALAGTRAARHAVESDAGADKKAAELLGQSARWLEEAARKTKRCADLEGEIVRKHKLN
jgi:hypothetical protein